MAALAVHGHGYPSIANVHLWNDVFAARADDGLEVTIQWHRAWNQVTKRSRGVTGWATLVSQPQTWSLIPGNVYRFHVCAQTPCTARWPPGQYGKFPPPYHVRLVARASQPTTQVAQEQAPGKAEEAPAKATSSGDKRADPAAEEEEGKPKSPSVPLPIAGETTALASSHGCGSAAAPSSHGCGSKEAAQAAGEAKASQGEASCGGACTLAPASLTAGVAAAVPEEQAAGEAKEALALASLTSGSAAEPLVNVKGKLVLPSAPLQTADKLAGSFVSLGCGSESDAAIVSGVCPQEGSNFAKVLQLARHIRVQQHWVGQSAFVCFALVTGLRVHLWQGENRINVLEVYAPWALPHCTKEAVADAVVCTYLQDEETGELMCCGVSDDMPLDRCNHYVAAIPTGNAIGEEGATDFESFYLSRGMCIMGTVADGDCGIDAMCVMAGFNQTAAVRQNLRTELSDFIFAHSETMWLQSALGCCQELEEDVPIEGPSSTLPIGGQVAPTVVGKSADASKNLPAVAEENTDEAEEPAPIDPEVLEAIKWATGLASEDMVQSCYTSLPKWCIADAIERFKNRPADPVQQPKPKAKVTRRRYCLGLLSTRMEAAKDYADFGQSMGLDTKKPLPWGTFAKYLRARPELSKLCSKNKTELDRRRRYFGRALRLWNAKDRDAFGNIKVKSLPRQSGKARFVRDTFRRRGRGKQGEHLKKAPIVREMLFEWFSVLRHSIDTKVMTRFPPKLVELKAKELIVSYVEACFKNGLTPNPPVVTGKWLAEWRYEYRVSFRKPNRKFKVPKHVLESRLEIFWLNVYRIRKLAVLVLGYDVEFENMDQSPFHMNEAGSQNALTLAMRGAPAVPVKEGHDATRARWSANTMTYSSEERAFRIPRLELMFKAEGDKLEQRLQLYVSNRFPWLTVVTGPKGSYREEHVLNFLEKALEPMGPNRKWRVLLLDSYVAQLNDNVRRLCWSRMYVVIIHGGGATGVTQTNDVGLHQHLRRDYVNLEMADLTRLSRTSPKAVHIPRPEQCIEWMASVWQRRELHVRAAKSYKGTGITNRLDAGEDNLIVKDIHS